jgi:hypothetical protein
MVNGEQLQNHRRICLPFMEALRLAFFPLCSGWLTRLRQLRRLQQLGGLVTLALQFSSDHCM